MKIALKNIAVDLIPMQIGGRNGGAKSFIINLITSLAKANRHTVFHCYCYSFMETELNKYLAQTNVNIHVVTRLNKYFWKQFESKVLEAVATFIKSNMKEYKESNINLQKGTVATFDVVAKETQALSKRALVGSMQFFTDKIGDVKLSKVIMEMLMSAAELVTPNFIAL